VHLNISGVSAYARNYQRKLKNINTLGIMRKDITVPEITDVAVAIVRELNEEGETEWNVYIINSKKESLQGVIVSSQGYGIYNDQDVKTSSLRHFFEEVPAESYQKIEIIHENLFGLNNEYWVSFYLNNLMYDKRYIFLPETIIEKNMVKIPIINKKGVMIK